MTGISYFEATHATSYIAVTCGTPMPETILVVHIEPGPIPTLIASAPAFIRNSAAAAVAILPTISWQSGKAFLIFYVVFAMFIE